jgi:hypothetical protein
MTTNPREYMKIYMREHRKGLRRRPAETALLSEAELVEVKLRLLQPFKSAQIGLALGRMGYAAFTGDDPWRKP